MMRSIAFREAYGHHYDVAFGRPSHVRAHAMEGNRVRLHQEPKLLGSPLVLARVSAVLRGWKGVDLANHEGGL